MESNNWEQRFDERYPHEQKKWVFKTDRSNIKSFISQEIEKAREEGRPKDYIDNDTYDFNLNQAVEEERQRIISLIEDVLPYGHDAVLEVLKTIKRR